MKKILFFIFILITIDCKPSREKIEEFHNRRVEHDRLIAECILKNENISPDLKKLIEENKDKNIFRALHPKDHKLDKNDRDVIRNCRREMLEKLKAEREREREREIKIKNKHNDNL